MAGPELSVVIPTLRSPATLARVLDGFAAQDVPAATFEVLVVADAAEPDLGAVDRAIGTRPYAVRRLTGGRPGASANRNAGRRAARAPVVAFCDDDTIPTRRYVAEHLRMHRAHPAEEASVLGHVRWAPELGVTPFMRWLDTGIQFDFGNIRGEDAGWGRFVTANVSVKRAFAERVGDFDEERLPFGYEDVDWARRAHEAGMRLLYARGAVADHLRPMDLGMWRRRVRRIAASERAFVALHPDVEPFFHKHLSMAAAHRPVRGRGRHLTRWVPRRTPWLGRRVWASADMWFKQQLAPDFLDAWDQGPK